MTLPFLLQVEAAVAAAKHAFPAWSERSPEQRAQVLNKLADLIDANLEELAQAESRDQGVLLSTNPKVRLSAIAITVRVHLTHTYTHLIIHTSYYHASCTQQVQPGLKLLHLIAVDLSTII